VREDSCTLPTVRNVSYIIVLTLLLSMLVGILWTNFQGKAKVLVLELFTIVPALIFVFVKRFSFRDVFRWHKVNGTILIVSGFIGLGWSVVTDELDRLLQILIPMPERLWHLMKDFLIFRSTEEMVILIIAVIFVASFAEEMLFRGFFQGALERATDVTKAVLISAFVFAVSHFNPWWVVEILIFGVLLGVLVWRSGSIFPGVVVHGVNNTLALVFINTDVSRLKWYSFKEHVSPLLLVLGLGFIFFGFRIFYRLTEKE